MRRIALAFAAAAVFALPLPASAAGTPPTDVSAQAVVVDPGGVGVRIGHGRYDSGRRYRDRDRYRDNCRTVTVRERMPGGGVRIIKRRNCR